MTIARNRIMATMIALFLMLTITATLVILPVANAHDPAWTIPTYAYVAAAPDTVGVGQYTLIVFWLDKYPPTAGGMGGDRWRGFKLDITKPDGNKETIPYTGTTSQVGSAWITYTPDQVGDYKIVFSWPGQTLTNGTGVPINVGIPYVGDFFAGSTSAPVTLTVTQEPLAEWVEPPLPDYWTRPINTANRNWAQLTSNWAGGSWFRYSGFQESGQAPNTPHVLYAKEIIHGGIADERYGAVKYDTTDYENFFGSPIVLSGKIYYNAGTYPNYGYYKVDLRTGETLWFKNGTDNGLNNPVTYSNLGGGGQSGPNLGQVFPQLSFGQLYHNYQVNGEGILNHLWMTQSGTPQTNTSGGTMWHMFDANTGNWVLSLKNVPSGTSVTDQDGNILLYSYSSSTGRFLAWNTSQSIPPPGPTGTGQQQWEPRTGAVIDAVNDASWTNYGPGPLDPFTPWYQDDILPRSGYTMNVTGPTGLPGLSNILQDENRVPRILFFNDMLNTPPRFDLGSSDMFFRAAAVRIDYHVAPYSPQPDKTNTQNNNLGYGVTLLYNKNITRPLGGNLTWILGPISYEDKVFTVWGKETRQWWGYSLDTGELLWGPTASQPTWDMYGSSARYAYGKLFSGGYSGILHAYDIKTGKLLWNYTLNEIGHESPYGNYQISQDFVADGKIFIHSSEHSPTQPLWRGSYLRAINVTDGKEIWKILDFVSGSAIADGYIVAGNHYDNRMYVYGKGPSAATVTVQNDVIAEGNSVLIKGMVTDESPGAKEISQSRGIKVPAIADADQQAWMEYLYMQQAIPANAKGVEVTLDTVDPNGNFVHIGTVTSDMSGMFKKLWTPEVPGEYTVIATFAGSESYGSSYAETAVGVTAAPQPSASPSPQPAPLLTLAPEAAYPIAGLVIAIIVALAVLMLIRQRKP